MRKTSSIIQVLLVLLAACCTPKIKEEPQTQPTEKAVQNVARSSTEKEEEKAEPAVTGITIDGDPSDWENYEILFTDPEGDDQGGDFDIAVVRAFINNQFLYMLIETYEPPTEYIQIDFDLMAGNRHFIASFKPVKESPASLGEIISDQFNSIGEIAGSSSAFDQALEFKVPLSALGNTDSITLHDVRPMGGECCDENWFAIDNISPVPVAQPNEIEPASDVVSSPQVCAAEIAAPIPFGSLQAAPIEIAEQGYKAEWFITPGAFNMPQDVLLTPQGGILVLATRNFALFQVKRDGSVMTLAENVYGYTSDVDAEGNAYLYSTPDGMITRVTPDGNKSVVIQTQDLTTDCTSGIGIGPDGNLYVARSLCDAGLMDMADLYRITLEGQVSRVADGIPALFALKTDAKGRFVGAAMGETLYEISLSDFSMTPIGTIPGYEGIAVNGLTVDTAGNLYVSTGTWSRSGQVFRFDVNGDFDLIADVPGNGLSGIEWVPETGELLGVQLQLGTLVSIASNGSVEEIIPGNGLITPRGIAFSPCGELAVSNEDGGMMALIDPARSITKFFDYNSFTSPVSFMVFSRDGQLYVTEGAPGFPERIVTIFPGESSPIPFVDVARPCGIVQLPDGTLFVAETIADRISRISSSGTVSVFADRLTRPSALALDADSNLYAVVGTGGRPLDEVHMPDAGDTIIRFNSDGVATELANWSKLTGIAFAPSGDLYAATGWDGGIVRISTDGTVTPFVSGLQEVTDVAFDLAGNLYASDTVLNGIIRIGGFPQGTLTGKVADASGLPVPEERVQVLSTDPIVAGQVVFTDTEGHFSIAAAPGSYDVVVSKEGFEMTALESIIITADQETILEINLKEQT